MRTQSPTAGIIKIAVMMLLCFQLFSCQKSATSVEQVSPPEKISNNTSGVAQYNMEIVLRGEGNRNGHIHFRQDEDAAKIISLDIKVHNLDPNREYLLQRAVDAINVVDGNCTSTSWLTLGYGLSPHSIMTNDKGDGQDELWRDVTAVPSGASFDIHFRVVDATTMAVVLTSECYQYTVR